MAHIGLVATLVCLIAYLPVDPAGASPPPTVREIAEAMRSCLPISGVRESKANPGDWLVTVDGMYEGFTLSAGSSNNEHYYHWWNPRVVLVFARIPPGVEPDEGWPELRAGRARVISCFVSVPPVPPDFGS